MLGKVEMELLSTNVFSLNASSFFWMKIRYSQVIKQALNEV